MFCKHCGASIGIDFREVYAPKHIYGISVSFVSSNSSFFFLFLFPLLFSSLTLSFFPLSAFLSLAWIQDTSNK